MILNSYRARLILFILLLIVFLSGTLIYSYQYINKVILDEADSHIVRLKELLNSHLNAEQGELQRYATIVAQDLRLQEYMYVITAIGGDNKPLETLYSREFGWLPIDRKMILDKNKKPLVGIRHDDLTNAVNLYSNTNSKGTFYFQGKKGLEVVSIAPIKYRDSILGLVVVSRQLNKQWLDANKKITEGEFLLVLNGKILLTTLTTTEQPQFDFEHNRLNINNNLYIIHQIDLPGNNMQKPALWFGMSEEYIVDKLNKHQRSMLSMLVVMIVGILIIGLIIIRNFSRPLNKLIQVTRQVSAGKIPALKKSKASNEFDELYNHFADMLQALSDHQEEITNTHEKLEKLAITDLLTGLYNRRYLMEVFPKLLAQGSRENLLVYATLLDLDHFKKINDTYGHLAGDQCLISFAEQLKHTSRTSDYLFRIGGEEFLILSIHKNIMDAVSFADKLRTSVEKTSVRYEEHLIKLTVSGGVSCAVEGNNIDTTLKQMLANADVALYKAKHSGRNRVCLMNTTSNTEAVNKSTK